MCSFLSYIAIFPILQSRSIAKAIAWRDFRSPNVFSIPAAISAYATYSPSSDSGRISVKYFITAFIVSLSSRYSLFFMHSLRFSENFSSGRYLKNHGHPYTPTAVQRGNRRALPAALLYILSLIRCAAPRARLFFVAAVCSQCELHSAAAVKPRLSLHKFALWEYIPALSELQNAPVSFSRATPLRGG